MEKTIMNEPQMPGNAATNYTSCAATPLDDLLRYVPKGLQLGYEMKNDDGTVYGHHHLPLGLHCHEAADLLLRYRAALNRLACLGNGNTWGNSDGNIIAQEALRP